ncbi:MAG TPA: response regulator transcription factor [Usitatibacter sp.]|nr:response regulator transcription factor [Usitatibacter sp.]
MEVVDAMEHALSGVAAKPIPRGMHMIRLLVVDDHDVVRIGLRQVFQGRVDMEIAGEARTGEEAIARIRAEPYDVALVDLSLADMSGVDVLTRAKAIRPEMAVLIVSGYPEDQYAINLLKAGAAGFVAKDAPPEHLVSAVIAASQGRRYVSPRTADRLAQGLSGAPGAAATPSHTQLSEREFQIFCRLAAGQSVSSISKELFISVKTVSTYRSRILEKMNFKTNADITYYAVKNQLIA